jgi:hypothetical protein
MAEARPYGLLAEFETPETLIDAVERTRAEGYRAIDAFTPFPIERLAELLELRDRRVLWLGFLGACMGFVVALAMQMYTNFQYPIDVGGRPLYALSAFAVVTFELTILFSALTAAVGMLYLNGLPRLHDPVFSGSRFHLASRDRFFLCIKADDPLFEKDAAEEFLRRVGARSVELIPA